MTENLHLCRVYLTDLHYAGATIIRANKEHIKAPHCTEGIWGSTGRTSRRIFAWHSDTRRSVAVSWISPDYGGQMKINMYSFSYTHTGETHFSFIVTTKVTCINLLSHARAPSNSTNLRRTPPLSAAQRRSAAQHFNLMSFSYQPSSCSTHRSSHRLRLAIKNI